MVHQDCIFIMVNQTAVIKVNRPYHGKFIIGHHVLAVDKPWRVLKNLNPRFHQIRIGSAGNNLNQLLVRNERSHDADIHSPHSSILDILRQVVVNDQIRRGNVDIVRSLTDDILIDRFTNLTLINRLRPAAIGNVKPFSFNSFIFQMVLVKICDFPAVDVPVHEKKPRQSLDCPTFQADTAIFPMAKTDDMIDILVRQIDTASIANLTVNDQNLAVVTVVIGYRHPRDHLVKLISLDTHFAQLTRIIAWQSSHAANIIIEQFDFNALRSFFDQDFQNTVPHQPFIDDIKLQKNKFLSSPQISQHGLKYLLTDRKIARSCTVIDICIIVHTQQ